MMVVVVVAKAIITAMMMTGGTRIGAQPERRFTGFMLLTVAYARARVC